MPRSSLTMPRFATRDFGTCLSFDGSNDQVLIANNASLRLTSAWTLAAWVKPSELPIDSGVIASVFPGTGTVMYSLGYGINEIGGASQLKVGFYNGSAWSIAAETNNTTAKTLNIWHHICGTFDGTTLKLYKNGALVGSTGGLTATSASTNGVYIGRRHDGSATKNFFPGLIDEAVIMNVALTDTQVATLYKTGDRPSGTVSYYKFDEGSGTSATDSVGSNTGTISGATYTTNSPFTTRQALTGTRFAVKDFGTCLNFAGGAATDNVSFADSNSLDLTNTLTIMAWIRPRSFGTSNAGRIIGKTNVGGTAGYDFLFDGANRTLRLLGNGTLYPSSSTNTIVTFNKWCQVAVTFDKDAGSNEIKFYVDGAAAGTASRNTALTANTDTLLIGNNNAATLTRSFDGQIDEVKIFNTALTPTQISNEYYSGVSNALGLVLYTKFDEGSGTSSTDSSGNQAAGTITGASYTTNKVRNGRTVIS